MAQPQNGALELAGRAILGDPRDDEREEIEVERLAVVVRRPFAMHAVGCDLTPRLLEQNPASGVFAFRTAAQQGERSAADVQRQRLSEQMRVRTEVIREVLLDVRE